MPLPEIQRRPLATSQSGFSEGAGVAERAQGSLFEGLANAARQLRAQLQPEVNQQARDQAAEDVVKAAEAREDGTFVVETPRRMILTQQDEVYNQTVTAGIAAQASNDIAAASAKLEQEYEFDPEGFERASKAFRDKYTGTSELGASLSLQIDQQADREFGATAARITARKRAADTAEKQQALEDRLNYLNGKMDTAIERDGPEGAFGLEYQDAEEEFLDVVKTLVNNPAFGWSEERAAELLDGVANRKQELVGISEMERVYREPATKGGGVVAAMKYIDRAVNSMELDQQERIGARSRMMQRLNWLQQMDQVDEKAKADRDKALIEAGEKVAKIYEAGLLERMGGGVQPTQQEIATLGDMVEAGWLEPARMQVYVNAATSTTPLVSDEINLAAMYDYARTPGVTREDVERVTLQSMGATKISARDREGVLDEFDKFNDDRLKPGKDMLEGFFATGFMDIDSAAVKTAKARAESDLLTWFEQNPDATRPQIEQRAKLLAVESGRRMPRPPMPQIQGFSGSRFVTLETVDEWSAQARAAALAALESTGDQTAFLDANRKIDEQIAWQREQARMMQESVSNVQE